MKIKVLQENIHSACSLASKFLPSKSTTLPVLSNLLLKADADTISLTASDLESTIQITIPGKVEENGSMLLPAKTGTLLIGSFSGEKVTISKKKQSVEVRGESSVGTLRVDKSDDFPQLDSVSGSEVAIDKELLTEIDTYVGMAASADQARAVLTGVCIDSSDSGVSFVATDGFRLAILTKDTDQFSGATSLLLPAKVIHGVVSILQQQDEKKASMIFDKDQNMVHFSCGSVRIVTRIIEGSFPDYKKILPGYSTMQVRVSRDELLQAVRFASVLARETANIIRISAKDKDTLRISSNAPQTGKNESTVSATISGDFVESAFNYRFIVDMLSAGKSDEVSYETSGSLSPGVFRFANKDEYTYIVMPVRLQDAE